MVIFNAVSKSCLTVSLMDVIQEARAVFYNWTLGSLVAKCQFTSTLVVVFVVNVPLISTNYHYASRGISESWFDLCYFFLLFVFFQGLTPEESIKLFAYFLDCTQKPFAASIYSHNSKVLKWPHHLETHFHHWGFYSFWACWHVRYIVNLHEACFVWIHIFWVTPCYLCYNVSRVVRLRDTL